MKRRPISGQFLAVFSLFFCVLFPGDARLAGAQGEQELGMRLVGTVVADEPGENLVIFEVQSTGRQGAFREGDRWGNILIKKIQPAYAVIDTDKGERILYLGSGASTGRSASSGEVAHLDRREVDYTLPDISQLMREIRVRPRFEGGQPAGFVIYGMEPESIFERMGLRDGDVIVSVNGRLFATTQPAVEFYDALKEAKTVYLEIRRGEKKQELYFEIQ